MKFVIKNDLMKYNLKTYGNFKDTKMLFNMHNKQHRKIGESSIISNNHTIKQRPVFFKLISSCRQIRAKRLRDPLFKQIHHHHHHYVVPLAGISQILSRHFSLSSIAFGRSSELHPVSSHSCCMYVRAGRPAFDRPYAGVHRNTLLINSSLLFQQCPACLVCLTWIVFVMGGRWPCSWCLVGCCCQDLFNIARNILV